MRNLQIKYFSKKKKALIHEDK